jgi:hypothetical protein
MFFFPDLLFADFEVDLLLSVVPFSFPFEDFGDFPFFEELD